MALMRWQPSRELDTLRQQIDRMFDDLLHSHAAEGGFGLHNMPFFSKTNGTNWAPAIELQETDTEIILKTEVPGVDIKDLDVQVSQEAVSIAGEHRDEQQTEEKGVFRSEFHYGHFQRVIPLHVPVQNDQVKAEFKQGILTLTMPKVEPEKRKVVKVNLTNN